LAAAFFDSAHPLRLRGFAPGAVKASLRLRWPYPQASALTAFACAAWVIPLGQLRPVTLPPHSRRRGLAGCCSSNNPDY